MSKEIIVEDDYVYAHDERGGLAHSTPGPWFCNRQASRLSLIHI